MNKVSYIIAVTLLLAAGSCTEFDEPREGSPEAGTPVTAAVSLKVAEELGPDGTPVAPTRVAQDVSVDEVSFNALWVLQFAGTGGDALLVAAPHYIDGKELAASGGTVNIPLYRSGGKTHRLVFLANVYDDAFVWKLSAGTATYADLKNCCIYLYDEERSYNRNNRTIMMSGTVEANIDGSDIGGVTLTRSLAKIRLDLKIDAAKAAGLTVHSIRMRDVQSRIDICDGQMVFPDVYPVTKIFGVVDYSVIVNADRTPLLTAGDAERTFVWYVTRNTRGAVGGLNAKTRNTGAPDLATYFEIVAKDASGNYVIYRIYPGADGEGDFNILPNHVYSYSLTIEGDGGQKPEDSRITHCKNDVVFEGSSNSFLINPPYAGMPARTFTIPVKRVKEYWLPAHHGYGGLGADPLMIPAGNARTGDLLEWEVSLLWQDAPDIVRPADTANPEKNIIISKPKGKGSGDNFQITVPPGARHGNFVVCIKCTDADKFVDGILWSWHFWVTGYEPRVEGVPVSKDKFVYPVVGGQVERYVHKYFGYSESSSAVWAKIKWDPKPSAAAPYAQSVVMDRFVGAMSKIAVADSPRDNGVMFQYGRKDPLPMNVRLYDISGKQLAESPSPGFQEQVWKGSDANRINAIAGIVNIPLSIRNPMTFLASDADWSGLNEQSYFWNDPLTVGKSVYVTKSIYDPCPEGWRMMMDVCTDFRNGITTSNLNRKLVIENGICYYPETGDNAGPPEANIVYTFTAARYWTSGGVWSVGYGYCWLPQPATVSKSYSLYYTNTTGNIHGTSWRPVSIPVRCVSDNYKGD